MKRFIREVSCALARCLLATNYGLKDDVQRIVLHEANRKIQSLERRNSILSIKNTVLRTRLWMGK